MADRVETSLTFNGTLNGGRGIDALIIDDVEMTSSIIGFEIIKLNGTDAVFTFTNDDSVIEIHGDQRRSDLGVRK